MSRFKEPQNSWMDENNKADLSGVESGDSFVALNMGKSAYFAQIKAHHEALQKEGISIEVAREFGISSLVISSMAIARVTKRLTELESYVYCLGPDRRKDT